MYNQSDCLPALDRYWALIRDGLRSLGRAAPDTLSWPVTALVDHWQRPDLVLSQTCGYPFRAVLKGRVTVIGTPDFGVDGCAPGFYRSVFIVRHDDPRRSVTAFKDARFAYNDAMSQSGWAAPQNHARRYGFQFVKTLQTGGHAQSALSVLEGRADLAAIDAVTWRFLVRNTAALAELRVLDATDPTPGLPYIAARGASRGAVFDAVASAMAALDAQDRETLGLKGLIDIPAAAYLAVPTPAPPVHTAHQN